MESMNAHNSWDAEIRRQMAITIKNVIFNEPATIVFWEDGTKTVVNAQNEDFDPEKGLAMAIAKKIYGNKGSYFNEIRKWVNPYYCKELNDVKNKRCYLSKEECEVCLSDFYKNAAKTIGYNVTDKTIFDCRKICVTTPVMDALWRFYANDRITDDYLIVEKMLIYGPKANLKGEGYEFEFEDGFVKEET